MSLTARQCRALDSIEQQLGAREPRLASMFAMFTRLTKDELLPPMETIQVRRWQWLADLIAGFRRRRQRRRLHAFAQRRTTNGTVTRFINVAFVPFIILSLVAAVLAVGGHGGSAGTRCGLVAGYHSAGIVNIVTSKCTRPTPSHH